MKVIRVAIIVSTMLYACNKEPAENPLAGVKVGTVPASGAELKPTAAADFQLPNQKQAYHGMVTAGQPSPDQFSKLKSAGYTAVVNLRADSEEGYWDERDKATMDLILYKHIPISSPDDLTRENVESFARTLEQPMAKNGKVLVHCGSGNRAGAMLALKAAWIDGRSVEDSLEIGRNAGMTEYEDAVKTLLEKK